LAVKSPRYHAIYIETFYDVTALEGTTMKCTDETTVLVPILYCTTADGTLANEISLLQQKVEELDKQVTDQKQIMKNALKKLKQGAWGRHWAQVQRQKIKRKNSDGKTKQQEFDLLTMLQNVRSDMEVNLKSLETQLCDAQNQLIQKRRQWIEILNRQLEESKQRYKQSGSDLGQVDSSLRIQTSTELEQFIEQQNDLLKVNLLDQSLRAELLRKNDMKVSKLKAMERELVGKLLGRFLSKRCTKAELVEKNILFDSSYESDQNFWMNICLPTCAEMRLFYTIETELAQENLLVKYEELEMGEKIGEGAYSSVSQAWLHGKLVAVKRLKHLRSSATKSFIREITALRKANSHPNVIKLIGACTKNLNLCIVTPFMKGGSIHDIIYKKGCHFSPKQALQISQEIASAMRYLHSLKLIHRDLTPNNILMHPNENGRAFICDFGISLFKEEKGALPLSPKGHPRYKAPEITNRQCYTKKVDVFMFGTVLYVLFANKRPFEKLDDDTVSIYMATGRLPEMDPQIPTAVQELIVQCWNVNPKQRPSFDEISRTLAKIEAKESFANHRSVSISDLFRTVRPPSFS
jgi:tRNA A-37 threonylcarbamoyl transferase component Bud32